VGGRGNDRVFSGFGADNLLGGAGNGYLADATKDPEVQEDNVSADAGNDVVYVLSLPASEDRVVCGGGFDRVLADGEDLVAPDCERVFIGPGSFDAWLESIPESFGEGLPPFPE
jgi:hypothetical protein